MFLINFYSYSTVGDCVECPWTSALSISVRSTNFICRQYMTLSGQFHAPTVLNQAVSEDHR
jgi:hypothetical protein